MFRISYDASNWYWKAADGRLFSSEKQSLVGADDADFLAWCAAGKAPTSWPKDESGDQTTASLQAVLPPGRYVDLTTYAQDKRDAILAEGLAVDVGLPTLAHVDTTSGALASYPRLCQLASMDAARTFDWVQSPASLKLTGSQVQTAVKAAYTFEQACWSAYGAVLAKITSGEIASASAVDAFAWPAGS